MVATARVDVGGQLLDYAKRLARFRAGRRAVLVRLSRLTKPYRQPSYQRAAREPFAHLLRRYDGQIFTLANQDFVCVLKGVPMSELNRAVLAVEAMVRDDPHLRAAEADGSDLEFLAHFFDIEKDYEAFRAFAEAVAAGRDPEELLPAGEAVTPAPAPTPRTQPQPVPAEAEGPVETDSPAPTPGVLARLLSHLARAEPRPFLRRGEVRLAGGAGRVVMERLGVDLDAVAARLVPGHRLDRAGPAAAVLREAVCARLIDSDPSRLARAETARPLLIDFTTAMLDKAEGRAWLKRLQELRGEAAVLPVIDAAEALLSPAAFARAEAWARRIGLGLAIGGLPLSLAPVLRDPKVFPAAFLLFSARLSARRDGSDPASLLDGLAPERLVWCEDDQDRRGAILRAFRLIAPF